jgi:hypothetical protein
MRSFIICAPVSQLILGYSIQGGLKKRAVYHNEREDKCRQNVGKPEGRRHLDLSLRERIILTVSPTH